jgi:putative transposase
VIVRYDPRDITTIFIYEVKETKEVFLTRAHAQGWETERLSYAEAQALSQRKREAGKAISNRSMLEEVRDRERRVKQVQRQQRQRADVDSISPPTLPPVPTTPVPPVPTTSVDAAVSVLPTTTTPPVSPTTQAEVEEEKPKKRVPYVRVVDYEQMRREAGLL